MPVAYPCPNFRMNGCNNIGLVGSSEIVLSMREYISLKMAALCKTLYSYCRSINSSLGKDKYHGTFPLVLSQYVDETAGSTKGNISIAKQYRKVEAWIAPENVKLAMKSTAVRQLVSIGILGLVRELVVYGSNDNRLRVGERQEWTVFHSNPKHLHQKTAVKQFSES